MVSVAVIRTSAYTDFQELLQELIIKKTYTSLSTKGSEALMFKMNQDFFAAYFQYFVYAEENLSFLYMMFVQGSMLLLFPYG